ncbi:WapI family immunity protein [Actinomadura rifamycini]|uniref:WapI family immunity protein n=1 Tax=Actinomadura rifamycini TaxID=31962 RepID=UPI00042716E7|nr:hypothetical protein [Actinomadura rifamycini]
MRLIDASGHGVELRVTGYQFPDDPARRYSWHMVEGSATCPEGAWTFRYPALTCDDSPHVAVWLRRAARSADAPADAGPPAGLRFTEPNLTLAVAGRSSGLVTLDVGLDLEFSPPWDHRHRAGDPYVVRCRLAPRRIEEAAGDWEREIAPYPNGPGTPAPAGDA